MRVNELRKVLISRAGQGKDKKWKQELTRMTEVTPTGRGVGWTGSKPQEEDLMWPVELWPGYWWPQCHRGEEGLCSLAEICPRVQLSHSCGWNFLSSTGHLGICDLQRFCLAPPVHLNSTGRMNKCSVVAGYEIWSTAAEKSVRSNSHLYQSNHLQWLQSLSLSSGSLSRLLLPSSPWGN